jgi:hypothetical protein
MTTKITRLVRAWMVIIAFAASACGSPPDAPRRDSSPRADDPVECRVSLNTGDIAVALRITDSKVIRALVLDPLEKAVVDMKPEKYVVMGSVSVKRRDGSEDGFVLFSPWGHCKKGGKYLIADLSAFQKVLKDALKRADEHLVGP